MLGKELNKYKIAFFSIFHWQMKSPLKALFNLQGSMLLLTDKVELRLLSTGEANKRLIIV